MSKNYSEVTTATANESFTVGNMFHFPKGTTDNPDTSNEILITSGPIFDIYEQAALSIFIYPLVIMIVFIVVGNVGNMFVLYIFAFRWERTKTSVFIITLAVLDIANCTINMPIEVAVLSKPISFDYDLFCKAARCFSYIVTASYSFVLVAVAFDRYLMICKPLKRMTLGLTYATRTCIGAVIMAIVLQWPSFFLYGTFTFKLPVPVPQAGNSFESNANSSATNSTTINYDNSTMVNYTNYTNAGQTSETPPAVYVFGKTCLVTNYYYYVNTLPTFLFQGFLFVCHVIIFLTLGIVYIIIGRKLFISSHVDIEDRGAKQGLLKRSIVSALTGSTTVSGSRSSRGLEHADSVSSLSKRFPNMRSRAEHCDGNNDFLSDKTGVTIESKTRSMTKSLIALPVSEHVSVPNVINEDCESDNKTRTEQASKPKKEIKGSLNQQMFYRKASVDQNPNLVNTQGIKRSISLDIGKLHSIGNGTPAKGKTDIKEISLKRNTLIMRMVTFTFILSYLPFLVLVTLRYSDDDIPSNLSKNEKIIYHVFLRSYFLNSVIRPFIYIVMNDQYRAKLFALIKPKCCK